MRAIEDVTLAARRCPRCGRTLPGDAPEGLCGACLFAVGTETLSGSADDAATIPSARDDSAALDDDGPRLAVDQVWGSYRIGRLLGRGGMGEVYEAEHTATGRRLALKVLRGQLRNASDRAQFLREGQLAASISHPHTVYIFGSEEISGMPVISMELLPGGTLKDRVAAQGPLLPAEAVAAVLDIIGGLDAAQSAGILHRDIKPSNCFIDSEGSVKVGDFGLSISTLARDVHQHTGTSGFQGTPQFAPPEQLRGEPLDVRADIYAVGATLYYLLTAQPPFDARDLQALFARVTTEPPKSPRLLRPATPSGLASVVVQCLAKTPAERPASYAALADALRPFSSIDEAPARPGVRLVAGLLDAAIVGLVFALWRGWAVDPIAQTAIAARVNAWAWLLNAAYYFVLEGLWGASLGKRLFGLRVISVSGASGAASWLRIARRTAVFFLPNLLITLTAGWLPAGMAGAAGANAFQTTGATLALVRTIATLMLTAALFATMRRRNGWAALHDIASGTRVVSRSAIGARRIGTADAAPAAPATVSAPLRVCYGPFVAVAEAGDTGAGRLFVGFDPVLRRQVWIHVVPPHTPAVSGARRDVGRIGRLHWLTGRRSADENWDAFESPDGGPFLTHERAVPGWPALKLWLLDLANELAAGAHDGSMPGLGLDRVWIRNDGHLVLLDFPAPAAAPIAGDRVDRTDQTAVGLLSAVATRGLSVAQNALGHPVLLPLSVRALLERWRSPAPPSLDEARTALIDVAAAPDRVWRWRRVVPIALASAPVLLLLVSALLAMPYLLRFLSPQNTEMVGWLDALARANPRADSRLRDPEIRDAVERYVAARFGAALKDESFWNSSVMKQARFAELRRIASEITTRHPSVSAEELAQVSAVIAPEIERSKQSSQLATRNAARAGVTIVTTLTAMALALVLFLSVLSSAIVPGGVVTRLVGLAVVRRDGQEIRRWRSLVRVLVAWSPAILWLAYLAASPKVQGWVPAPASPLPGISLALGVLAIGAIWSVAQPTRGPHDWLSGSWIVPR